MNFFQRQDEARKKTVWLVILYLAALVTIVLTIHSLVVFFPACVTQEDYPGVSFHAVYWQIWFSPLFLLCDTGAVLAIIGGASLLKTVSLKAEGGDGVAVSLGGVLIRPDTLVFQERRLLHIVEEMALASGIRVPNVYILKEESSINAFAAGFTPATSVIAVTQGALDYLNRDELQGVIGHEFSHILNNDTNLNLKLIGVLFGLEILVLLGMVLFRITTSINYAGSNRNSKEGNSVVVIALMILLFSLAIMAVGWIGQFFSNLIRAAISRQREFLADASSVQFTRNPNGIAGALKKIGCPRVGSDVRNSHSTEMSHLFFSNIFSPGLLSRLFDSHPNLTERIKRIDPSFDGNYPNALVKLDEVSGCPLPPSAPTNKTPPPFPGHEIFNQPLTEAGLVGTAGNRSAASLATAAVIFDEIGRVGETQLRIADGLLQKVPDSIRNMVVTQNGAMAAVSAILLDSVPEIRDKEMAILRQNESPEQIKMIQSAFDEIKNYSPAIKIPIAELAFPTLKIVTKEDYRKFRQTMIALIGADEKVDILEFTIQGFLINDLDRSFGLTRPTPPRYNRMNSLLEPFYSILSFCAYAGSDRPEEIQAAFDAGCAFFYLESTLVPREKCRPADFAKAIATLGQATFVLRHKILTALYCCVTADQIITEREGELIRAISAWFDCPMPIWTPTEIK